MQRLDPLFVPLDAAHEPNDEAYTLAWQHLHGSFRTQPRPVFGARPRGPGPGARCHLGPRPERTVGRSPWAHVVASCRGAVARHSRASSASLRASPRSRMSHPVYLARIFKKYYHCSLGVYARRLRLALGRRPPRGDRRNRSAPLRTPPVSTTRLVISAGYSPSTWGQHPRDTGSCSAPRRRAVHRRPISTTPAGDNAPYHYTARRRRASLADAGRRDIHECALCVLCRTQCE